MSLEAILHVPDTFFRNKRVFLVAPHPDDDAIGCGALLFYIQNKKLPSSVHIAYAVSGFNGVTDRHLKKQKLFDETSEANNRKTKVNIRKEEALAYCRTIGAEPIFWNLPFYETKSREFGPDIALVSSSIKDINPDVVIVIDEASDPHGTHGFVREIVVKALTGIAFEGAVLGYRVWDSNYLVGEADLKLSFGKSVMKRKEELISLYSSQLQDPAHPCDHKNFIELIKSANAAAAQNHKISLPYLECYKKIEISK